MDISNDFYKEYAVWQLEKVNKERAIAVKALQEIELHLMQLPINYENFTIAYMLATEALKELGEE